LKSALKKSQSDIGLQRQQSSSAWKGAADYDLQNLDGEEIEGVYGLKHQTHDLNERYLHCMSGDPSRIPIESLVKPLEFVNFTQFNTEKDTIYYIQDLKVVELRSSNTINVLVLFPGDIDKMVGTRARYPVYRLCIF
jgi:hypothetical protein